MAGVKVIFTICFLVAALMQCSTANVPSRLRRESASFAPPPTTVRTIENADGATAPSFENADGATAPSFENVHRANAPGLNDAEGSQATVALDNPSNADAAKKWVGTKTG